MNLKERVVRRLTDAYNKNPHSNISKLISVFESEFEELESLFHRIEDWRIIDNAKGDTLDRIGLDLRQPRGGTTDEVYRVLLKSKRARDLSEGDTNTIIEVIAMVLGAEKDDIGIQDLWYTEENEPSAIKVVKAPIKNLNSIGMSNDQFSKFVSALVAAGVEVISINLQGTFEYGSIDIEFNNDKGFSDTEQRGGGFYGTLYQPNEEQGLPI